jgi:hypothetical protein
MSDKRPTPEFGRRRPAGSLPPQPGPKRSSHVALLVMGTLAVGGGAYALMPRESCVPPAPAAPGMAAPAMPPTNGVCTGGSSRFSGNTTRTWRLGFYGGDNTVRASSAGVSDAGSGGVTRGGFGSFGRAFGFGGG